MWLDERDKTAGSTLANPKFSICCKSGRVKLRPVKPPDEYIIGLLDGTDQDGDGPFYQQNIRAFNSALTFASLEADQADITGRGPQVFKMQSESYHRIGSLLYGNGAAPIRESDEEKAQSLAAVAGSSTEKNEIARKPQFLAL